MTSIIQRFVASRPTPQQRQQIANVDQGVSRADFEKLVTVVTNMAAAVEGLIEDFDAATAPEKLQAVVNAAFKGMTPPSNGRAPQAKGGRSFIAPKGDDDDNLRVNVSPQAREPLAPPADRTGNTHLAPQGD